MDKYKCTVCEWEGDEDELQELPGFLWDYTSYELCPLCWLRDCIYSGVERINDGK